MAGFINWFPLIRGLTINPLWLKIQFVIMFVGVNLTFFPIHFLGLAGMPRRYSDYPDRFARWNLVARIGSLISVIAVMYFLVILWEAFARQRARLSRKSLSSSLEIAHSFPPINHRYRWCPKLFY
jgi:cytochrome c oxidase subunit 1